MKKISEGAEAVIYDYDILDYDAVVKERVAKEYRVPALDSEIREQRTKSEAKILAKASSGGANVPKVLMLSKYGIVMSKLQGEMLNSIIRNGEIDTAVLAEAGRQLALLHSSNIVHGDYTPANILVAKGAVYVIDFGLGEITGSSEEKALDVLLMKRSINKSPFAAFLASYTKHYKEAKSILERLEEIERRGRYQTRTLLKA